MSVGLVVVSHSAKLAEGVVELAAQMASDVSLVAAGGMDDGGIGTSLEKVMEALGTADSGDGVAILTDLGSAVMTAESALEFLGNPDNVRLADAALVEGAIAAAVAAQAGASLADVLNAAEHALDKAPAVPGSAGQQGGPGTQAGQAGVVPSAAGQPAVPTTEAEAHGVVSAELILINPLGMHARPAAVLAGELGAMDVEIDINGVDGQSVMLLMTLGAGKGQVLNVRASGPDAERAVAFVKHQVEDGFGEL